MRVKRFNTTGTCFPGKHYMVDISERIEIIRGMVENGDYFCINRGRQYGKTTTLYSLKSHLKQNYTVFSMSLESVEDEMFSSAGKICSYLLWQMNDLIENDEVGHISSESAAIISSKVSDTIIPIELLTFRTVIKQVCAKNDRGVVLIVDEVDQAGNFPSFIKLLGVLRDMFLNREERPTFQSVILAGVYDIKNLKLKIRPDGEHQYNSPWNIAVPFDVDMSLHADGIAGMLVEYKSDHNLDFDEKAVAQEIHNYTSGYPFLVSRLCQIIDNKNYTWNREGVVCAVHDLLNEENTLFDDMVKKMDDFPELRSLMQAMLYIGERKNLAPDEKYVQLGLRFCFLKKEGALVKIANRILETRLYNLFASESQNESIFTRGSIDKNQFVVNGMLDVRHLIERFVVNFNEIYSAKDEAFIERHGRQFFLLYLKPIINGVGNYYVEAETRDETRTDIVIDYLGHQYVIELKIWRGNSYNERGEKQLAEYLDYFHLETGYLVSFCFNRNKQVGVQEVAVGEKKVYEAVV